jgi:homoserine dehydrogenase
MKTKLILIGCGTVGKGLLQIIHDKEAPIDVIGISDKLSGSILDPDGIDIAHLLNIFAQGGKVSDYDKASPSAIKRLNPIETIQQSDADVMAEMTYTNIETGQPATSYIEAAFKKGIHVTTSNKGPTALYYRKLARLAEENNVKFLFEGTVMSGTPVFNLARECLHGCDFKEIKGILNGTTNFILTKMEQEGWPYEQALKEAQKLGYAEADPTADIEGLDALAKIVILSNVLLGGDITPDDVECQGITKISLEDIRKAANEGMRYKLIANTKVESGKITASVKPMKIPLTDPLASVGGAINALTFDTDLLGKITIQGPGAGKIETGFSIFTDILSIIKR